MGDSTNLGKLPHRELTSGEKRGESCANGGFIDFREGTVTVLCQGPGHMKKNKKRQQGKNKHQNRGKLRQEKG